MEPDGTLNCESYFFSSVTSFRARSACVASIARSRTNARMISMFNLADRSASVLRLVDGNDLRVPDQAARLELLRELRDDVESKAFEAGGGEIRAEARRDGEIRPSWRTGSLGRSPFTDEQGALMVTNRRVLETSSRTPRTSPRS
jgi:hypothetical protein